MSRGCCACAEEARTALLASSSIDRNGGSRCKNEGDGVTRVYLYRTTGDQIQVTAGRHPGGDGGVQAGRLVVDRDEPLGTARKGNRIGAVVPPVVDVGARDHVAEAHHLQNRRVAVLTDPLARTGGLEARRAGDGGRPTFPVRGRAPGVPRS